MELDIIKPQKVQVKSIEELLGKITQGEWRVSPNLEMPQKWFSIRDSDSNVIARLAEGESKENADFIAAAPSIIRQLIKERNAYREIACNLYEWKFQRDPELMDNWDGKTKYGDEVDKLANRLVGRRG